MEYAAFKLTTDRHATDRQPMEEGSRTKISKKGELSEDTEDRLRYIYDEG